MREWFANPIYTGSSGALWACTKRSIDNSSWSGNRLASLGGRGKGQVRAIRESPSFSTDLTRDGTRTPEDKDAKNVYWMFTVLLVKKNRDAVIAELAARGIETRPAFTPMHKQPPYRNWHSKACLKVPDSFCVAETLGELGLNLPSSNGLTDDEIHTVVNALEEILR